MPPEEFTALLMLLTAMSFTPGPNTALSTTLAANHGLRQSMKFVVAVPAGWCVLLLLCSAGLGALITEMPSLRLGVKMAGIAYLLWLASKLSSSGTLTNARADLLQVGFLQGIGLQFINIKAWLLALTIVAGWVAGQEDWPLRMAIVLPCMIVYAFFSNLLYACMGAALRRWLGQGQRLLWFNRFMALLLAVTAVWMAYA